MVDRVINYADESTAFENKEWVFLCRCNRPSTVPTITWKINIVDFKGPWQTAFRAPTGERPGHSCGELCQKDMRERRGFCAASAIFSPMNTYCQLVQRNTCWCCRLGPVMRAVLWLLLLQVESCRILYKGHLFDSPRKSAIYEEITNASRSNIRNGICTLHAVEILHIYFELVFIPSCKIV